MKDTSLGQWNLKLKKWIAYKKCHIGVHVYFIRHYKAMMDGSSAAYVFEYVDLMWISERCRHLFHRE